MMMMMMMIMMMIMMMMIICGDDDNLIKVENESISVEFFHWFKTTVSFPSISLCTRKQLEYLKSFPYENFTSGNLHFNAFDLEKSSKLSSCLTRTLSYLTSWPWFQFSHLLKETLCFLSVDILPRPTVNQYKCALCALCAFARLTFSNQSKQGFPSHALSASCHFEFYLYNHWVFFQMGHFPT